MTSLDSTVVDSRAQVLSETRNLALRLLARREHSELELRNKLFRRGIDENVISTVLAELCGNDLLSDERFAETYVRVRKDRGYGPLKIHAELRQRGVAEALIRAALNASDEFWLEHARRVLEKRFTEGFRGTEDETKKTSMRAHNELARQARFLSARGFPSAIIYRSLDAQTV